MRHGLMLVFHLPKTAPRGGGGGGGGVQGQALHRDELVNLDNTTHLLMPRHGSSWGLCLVLLVNNISTRHVCVQV